MHFTKKEILFMTEILVAVIAIGLIDWICDLMGLGTAIKFTMAAVILIGTYLVDRRFVHSKFPEIIAANGIGKMEQRSNLRRWFISVLIFFLAMLASVAIDRFGLSFRMMIVLNAVILVFSYFPAYKMAPYHYTKEKKFLWSLSALLLAGCLMLGLLSLIGTI